MLKEIKETELYRSAFRHSFKDTPRNRALMVIDNVFLHLHPVRVSRHAVDVAYTWGMGGISFLLFLILTMVSFNPKKWVSAFVISLFTVIISYLVFSAWLKVQLPIGPFGI